MAANDAPTMPIAEPERKPNLRPRRIISIEAGKTDSMTPKCCMVIGRFAHMRMSGETMVSTASAEEANIRVLLLCVSAWQIASSAMLRMCAPRHAAAGRCRRFLHLDRAIHWARTLVVRLPPPKRIAGSRPQCSYDPRSERSLDAAHAWAGRRP